MPLPKIDTPVYELILPSQDKQIKFRPFLVKEEKILLMALEDGSQKAIITAIKQIVKSCTELDVDDLPLFDLEYIFLNIRAKSVGEVAHLRVRCPDDLKTFVDVDVDLTKIEVQVDDEHSKKIVIDEDKNIGLMLRYPSLNDLDETEDLVNATPDDLFKIIARGIDYVYEGEKIYKSTDYSTEEMNDFIESLRAEVLNKIKKFYDTSPKLRHEVEVTNPNTNVKGTVVLQGLNDFFG